jgi:hypothetical protein
MVEIGSSNEAVALYSLVVGVATAIGSSTTVSGVAVASCAALSVARVSVTEVTCESSVEELSTWTAATSLPDGRTRIKESMTQVTRLSPMMDLTPDTEVTVASW